MVSDAPGAIKDLMKNNWSAANTDEKTPTFDVVYDRKEISVSTRDWILTYNAGMTPAFNGIGSSNFKKFHAVTIDSRSSYQPDKDKTISPLSTVTGHQHLMKLLEEIERIIKLKKNDPGGGFQVIRPNGVSADLSDRRKKLYRFTYSVMLIETNT